MDSGNKKILIAEDEKPLSRALELKLQHEGFEVVAVSNGEMAISLLSKEKFFMIICDLVMPKVNGFKVLEHRKENNIDTPIIILTNLSQEEDEKRVLLLGATEFFVKSNTPLSKIVDYIKNYSS